MKRSRLLAIVAAIGILSAQAASAASYRVLTYNLGLLKVLGSNLVPMVDARAAVAPRELARFARDSSPQIIVLEEVWNDRHAKAIVDALEPLGYSAVRPVERGLLGLTSGLLLLLQSPLRVLDWRFTRFTRNTFMDSFSRKGVLEATLEDPSDGGARIALVAAHTVALDTSNGTPKDKGQVDAFNAQADQILSALRNRSEGGMIPALLVGDFNVGPGYADAEYRRIADSVGLVEVGASLSPQPLITWDPGNPLVKYGRYPAEPPAKIDHVFMQNGASGIWKAIDARLAFTEQAESLALTPKSGSPVAVPLSDHYGFLAEVRLFAAP